MIAELECVVLDCPDPSELADFYASLLGGEVDRPDRRWECDAEWSTLHTPGGLVLAFQRVAGYRPPRWPGQEAPQQFHLDFGVTDRERSHEEVLAAGASLLGAGDEERGWRVYADPAGHPFCLVGH
ncbi:MULTISPECIES: VOC family protein [Streptomyces]|uniref:VOC family protein n=1 Tax=Streptomyces TaxID=1883 RepID=UPI0029B4416C|nr:MULTISPECIES: VOC family protein [unclassified Streptomyces]MDX3608117.1 VOC family protein [Streptomyces sp. FL06-04B]MDX3738650.1 VOC family protein [Streptomyces sp. ID01-15D]